ncbi:MAG: glycosyltransferase family 2 protein [Candidatus Sulfotelmatobacter sp.]
MKMRETTPAPVCAVVVTYHPSAEMVEGIPKVLSQVQAMVVVNNGSDAAAIEALRALSRSCGIQLIENEENVGVAEALNQGIRWAKNSGYAWVILFDQDSTITDGFVDKLFRAWENHPGRERVGSIHPRYVHPKTGAEPRVRRASDGGPVFSLTSGALMPVWIFDKIGGFASEYFIDCVDFEYCLRIRAAGYLIADSREAVLLHAAGDTNKSQNLLGFRFCATHHSATRRYYMSRNRVALYRKYFSVFPGWVVRSMSDSVRETIKCFVGERDSARKFRNFLLGTWDGLTGRMGKREGI